MRACLGSIVGLILLLSGAAGATDSPPDASRLMALAERRMHEGGDPFDLWQQAIRAAEHAGDADQTLAAVEKCGLAALARGALEGVPGVEAFVVVGNGGTRLEGMRGSSRLPRVALGVGLLLIGIAIAAGVFRRRRHRAVN